MKVWIFGTLCACFLLCVVVRRNVNAEELWESEAAEEFAREYALTEPIDLPEVDGPWRQTVRNPDLGSLTGHLTKEAAIEANGKRQEPVDFAIWKAADGTWQLVSCIRNTKEVGYTRLFFRWEGMHLTDTEWEPKGIFHRADPDLGESPGFLQAPHVILIDGVYHFFYNSGASIFCMTSEDGKNFTRRLNRQGSPVVTAPCGRDMNIMNIDGGI